MIFFQQRQLPAILIVALIPFASACAESTKDDVCVEETVNDADYVICRFDPAVVDVRLFLRADKETVFGGFDNLVEMLNGREESLVFAMNAGMYHRDRSPVGLYVEDGIQIKKANTNDGPGNFHLKPNGVFYILENGTVGVAETEAFQAAEITPQYATQSGPMLVIDGDYHPRFLPDSTSRKIRNGVGVTASGEAVFVKSDTRVTFHEFARLFVENLRAQSALYLDGTISRLYAPNLNRNDDGFPMGPIVGVVEKNEGEGAGDE